MATAKDILSSYSSLFQRQSKSRLGIDFDGNIECYEKSVFYFPSGQITEDAQRFLQRFASYENGDETFFWGCICYNESKYSATPLKDEYVVSYAIEQGNDLFKIYTLLSDKGIHLIENDKHSFTLWSETKTIKYWLDKHPIQYVSGNSQNTNTKQWKKLFRELSELGACNTTTSSTLTTKSINNTYNMSIDKKKIEYVIGIDLGHGETSAALCAMQWDEMDDRLDPAKDLEMEPNRKVIPSAITITADDTEKIGTAAFSPDILKQAHVNVCFKRKPKDINGEAEKLMMRFMKAVYRKIRENNGGMLTDNNHLVYIATPSGWDKQAQNLYLEMAKQAGIPMGGITKESRAAFVRAQHDPTANLGRNIEKGAIVFDMGSSTLDFTYHNSELTVDNGYDCGASFVEKSMFGDLEKNNVAIREFRSKYPDLVDYLLFEVRRAKEEIYFDTSRKYKKTINFEDFIDDEDLEDERFRLKFESGELNEFLEGNGYIGSIRDAMRDYITNCIPGKNIFGVFLTGGASRMDFIKPLVSQCWNIPEDKIFRDQDPSLTISQGVAEVARADLRTADLDTDLEPIFRRVSGAQIYDSFVDHFGGDLSGVIINKVEETICAWRDSSYDQSLNQLNGQIKSTVREWVRNGAEAVNDYVTNAIVEQTEELRNKVDAIVAAYTSQGVNIQLPDISNLKLMDSNTNLNMDSVMRELANSIETESNGWGGIIAGAGVGAAVAMILGGPLAWIIGGGALLGRYLFGQSESEEEKKRKTMEKKLSANERAQIVNGLSEKWDDIQNTITRSVFDSLRKNSQAKRDLSKMVDKILNAYKEALTKSRIMVD